MSYEIQVENLTRVFKYYHKDSGLKGSFRNLFKRQTLYKTAVDGVSFTIPRGEIVGFIGPNGAGKTTTLKMLSGILHPSAGTATVGGFVPWERKIAYKKYFTVVMGQRSQLWWDLPALETFHLIRHIYEIDKDTYQKNLDTLTEILDVGDLLKVQVRRLSLGERMKMDLIASFLYRPSVIFLDEPTIGLDVEAQNNIRDFLKEYNRRNEATILLTSHYVRDIEDLCHRTLVINDGVLVYDGDLLKMNETFSHRKMITFTATDPLSAEELKRYGEVLSVTSDKATLEIDRDKSSAVMAAIMQAHTVTDFNIEEIPLEKSILQIYQSKERVMQHV